MTLMSDDRNNIPADYAPKRRRWFWMRWFRTIQRWRVADEILAWLPPILVTEYLEESQDGRPMKSDAYDEWEKLWEAR